LLIGLNHMDRNADRTRLIGDRTRDRLANPPCRVRAELKPLRIVKFIDRLDKAEIAFLDKIEKVHTATCVSLCDADNESKVGFSQMLA